jgi:hypothetical protein
MFKPGDIISHTQMCSFENYSLQQGMNYKIRGKHSVILMSQRANAPYTDKIEADGKVLSYEGHNIHNKKNGPNPNKADQPMHLPSGKLTANGKFYEAAKKAEEGETPELVHVYEKIKPGIWSFNGVFKLVSADIVNEKKRKVFKFKLEITDQSLDGKLKNVQLNHERLIPSHVKLEVWKRDQAKCVTCGSTDNLHFDHILPFSKGGSSLIAKNIQLLCARHNLEKSDKIE